MLDWREGLWRAHQPVVLPMLVGHDADDRQLPRRPTAQVSHPQRRGRDAARPTRDAAQVDRQVVQRMLVVEDEAQHAQRARALRHRRADILLGLLP
jgi:hypothetical protein